MLDFVAQLTVRILEDHEIMYTDSVLIFHCNVHLKYIVKKNKIKKCTVIETLHGWGHFARLTIHLSEWDGIVLLSQSPTAGFLWAFKTDKKQIGVDEGK